MGSDGVSEPSHSSICSPHLLILRQSKDLIPVNHLGKRVKGFLRSAHAHPTSAGIGSEVKQCLFRGRHPTLTELASPNSGLESIDHPVPEMDGPDDR